MSERIPSSIIVAAKAGDSEALQKILCHYSSYIASVSKRGFFDEYGNRYELVDEDCRQRIEAKLMYQIIYKFDPYKIPSKGAE